MAIRKKTGGRRRGVPNRRTLELAERLEGAGFDPVQVIIDVASDAASTPELRLRAASELLPFLYPKRRAVDHRLTDENGADRPFTLADMDRMFAKPDAADAALSCNGAVG
jgi:hypothetical protein